MAGVAGERNYDIVLCDLDGVVWLGGEPIPGSVDAVERLRRWGVRIVFVTNSSAPTIADHTAALAKVGIEADGDVISSATASAELVSPRDRVLVCGGEGIVEAVKSAGAYPIGGDDDDGVAVGIDTVIAGFHTTFDYHRLQLATAAVRAGARFVATNRDPLFPTPTGPIPGGGSIVAAIAVATGVEPETAGKPHAPMARAVFRLLDADPDDIRHRLLVVGDQFLTDGRFASELGARFALVRTGNTASETELVAQPDYDCADLAAVANTLGAT